MQIPRQQPIYIAPTMAPRPTRTAGVSHAQPAFGASQPKPAEAKALPWYTRAWNGIKKIWNQTHAFVLTQWWLLTNPVFRKMLATPKTIDAKRTATHELGHLLTDVALGFDHFDKISIVPTQTSAGHVKNTPGKFMELAKKDVEKGIFQLITSLYAGDALDAQHNVIGGQPELLDYYHKITKLSSLGALTGNDQNKIQDLINLLIEINNNLNPNCNESEILQGSYDTIQALYHTVGPNRIEEMVNDLVAQKTIEGPDNIRAFIDKHLKDVDWKPVQEKFNALIKKSEPKKKP